MFGFKKRHEELMKEMKQLNFIIEQMLCKLAEVEASQEPITDVTRELNETVIENGNRLNLMINELKGAVAMSRASLPQRDYTPKVEPTKGRKKPGRPPRSKPVS